MIVRLRIYQAFAFLTIIGAAQCYAMDFFQWNQPIDDGMLLGRRGSFSLAPYQWWDDAEREALEFESFNLFYAHLTQAALPEQAQVEHLLNQAAQRDQIAIFQFVNTNSVMLLAAGAGRGDYATLLERVYRTAIAHGNHRFAQEVAYQLPELPADHAVRVQNLYMTNLHFYMQLFTNNLTGFWVQASQRIANYLRY